MRGKIDPSFLFAPERVLLGAIKLHRNIFRKQYNAAGQSKHKLGDRDSFRFVSFQQRFEQATHTILLRVLRRPRLDELC